MKGASRVLDETNQTESRRIPGLPGAGHPLFFGAAPRPHPRNDSPRKRSPGAFTAHRHASVHGERAYKLYVPSVSTGRPMPLVVMLHGCKQDPDDFARGTAMNELAERHGCLVAYPAQSPNANGSNCWNWFRPADQRGDQGEPALIAGIVRDIVATHAVDERRVFAAGLSAGGAMAVVLGATRPEIFRGIGVHSGLPFGKANDVASAFGAMQGRNTLGLGDKGHRPASHQIGVPTIVFHGDGDTTVAPSNADEIVEQALLGSEQALGRALAGTPPRESSGGGREHLVTTYVDSQSRSRVERWLIRGGSHAWSGGDASGSFTDSAGPDASAEMLRFFLQI